MTTRRPLDFYETLPGLTHALLGHVPICGHILEPAAGNLAIAHVLDPQVDSVITNDINADHLTVYNDDATDKSARCYRHDYSWVVANPPFNQAMAILENSYEVATVGVAFLLRLTFLEPTGGRKEWLKEHERNMSHLLIFGSPRPSFTGNGTDSVTTAWMVWQKSSHKRGADIIFVPDWKGTP